MQHCPPGYVQSINSPTHFQNWSFWQRAKITLLLSLLCTMYGIYNHVKSLMRLLYRAVQGTDVQKDVYICFIDYTKAYDRVKHFKMIECLSEIGMDDKDLQIITKLYWEQPACVRTESGMTSEFKIKKGVRQGCVLSPHLFNLYTEKIFREAEDMKGINIGGVNINNLRYADDTSLTCRRSYVSTSFTNSCQWKR